MSGTASSMIIERISNGRSSNVTIAKSVEKETVVCADLVTGQKEVMWFELCRREVAVTQRSLHAEVDVVPVRDMT